eukprot:4118396-Prymnesium_polylepis.1
MASSSTRTLRCSACAATARICDGVESMPARSITAERSAHTSPKALRSRHLGSSPSESLGSGMRTP